MFRFENNGIIVEHKFSKDCEDQSVFDRHIHFSYEILYLVRGDVILNVESERRKMDTGELVLVLPGQYHFAQVSDDEPYERYVVKFQEEIVPAYLRAKLGRAGHFFKLKKEITTFFAHLEDYARQYPQEDLRLLYTCDILRLLVLLCNEGNRIPDQDDIVLRVVEYINRNICESISLDRLSQEFNFSKSYISNKFKASMQIPIMQYVRYKKIICAQQMILAGEKKSYVCKKLGFENYSTFYRNYVSVFGENVHLSRDASELLSNDPGTPNT